MPRLTSSDRVCFPRVVMTCHNRLWKTHTVEQCQAWHAIIAFGLHKWSDGIGCGMKSPPLYSTHGQKTSSTA